MQEQRRNPRTALEAWVEIASEGRRLRGTSLDLSVGGMGLEGAALRADAPALVEFPLPGIGLPLELQADVVWADPDRRRAGLRFRNVDAGLQELMASFVEGRLAG